MVYLFVDNFDDESELEKALVDEGIEFQVYIDILVYGLNTPYIVVDGVPLDEKRAWKWIKEK